MSILFSKKTRGIAESYSITPEELVFADLLASNWDMVDAYFVAIGNTTWTKAAVTRAAREIAAKIGVKKRIKELRRGELNDMAKNASEEPKKDDFDVTDALSKEQMLKDLYLARKKMTPGSKDWLDVNKLIADITRMKQEEIKKEENIVHYFLPLTCEHCALYKKSKEV